MSVSSNLHWLAARFGIGYGNRRSTSGEHDIARSSRFLNHWSGFSRAYATLQTIPIAESRLALQQLLDRTGRLPRSLRVFNQREPHESFAQRPKSDSRRHRHQGLFEQRL